MSASSITEICALAKELGFPVALVPIFSLRGGRGYIIAEDESDLPAKALLAILRSPAQQVELHAV